MTNSATIAMLILAASNAASAFCPPATTLQTPIHQKCSSSAIPSMSSDNEITPTTTRANFLSTATSFTFLTTLLPFTANARGRATLEQSYERYAPRIVAGGEFYSTELKAMIEKKDWAAIKAATSEPPKRTKEDLAKPDAGVSDRAAQAGDFSDARVLVAADLFAAAFSDNSISAKTKMMQEKVGKVREVVKGINSLAKQALGEEKAGGLFGLGAKNPTEQEIQAAMTKLYDEGKTYWNEYVTAANEGLAVQITKFSYL